MNQPKMPVAVKTFQWMEELVAEEMKTFGVENIHQGKRIVHGEADLETLYRLNYCSRFGLRVFVPILSFSIRNAEELYKKVRQFDWTPFLKRHQTFAIDPNVHSVHFRHPHFASLRMKDAMADQYRDKFGDRPSVDTDEPDVLFQLHIDEHRVTISLDSSGESLNRRGYRTSGAKAPLNEVLAAAIVQLSGWEGERPLVDPMCGSGTLLLEAWLQATNAPSQLFRRNFGFMQWSNFDESLWHTVQEEAKRSMRPLLNPIIGSDAAPQAVEIARRNLKAAGIDSGIELTVADFFELEAPAQQGVLIMNPPYGERIEPEQLMHFYKRIGDSFKQNWAGWDAWVFSGNIDALKQVGLRPSRKIPLMNGPIECRLMRFELYQGSKQSS